MRARLGGETFLKNEKSVADLGCTATLALATQGAAASVLVTVALTGGGGRVGEVGGVTIASAL